MNKFRLNLLGRTMTEMMLYSSHWALSGGTWFQLVPLLGWSWFWSLDYGQPSFSTNQVTLFLLELYGKVPPDYVKSHSSSAYSLIYINVDFWIPILLSGLKTIIIIILMLKLLQVWPVEGILLRWLLFSKIFWHVPITLWAHAYFLAPWSVIDSSCTFPALEISYLPKELWFLLMVNNI